MNIIALACAVPRNEVPLEKSIGTFPEDTVRKISDTTGIRTRRVAPRGMSASDLSVEAAETLFKATDIDRRSVDALLFVSQTGDYLTPTTSSILQDRLSLPETTFTLDLNKGCTGFTDGLIVARSLLHGLGMNRVLLIASDAVSKCIDPDDQATAMLFGDAASVTLLEKSEKPFHFGCGTDGSGFDVIRQDAGYRVWDAPDAFPATFRSITTRINGAKVFDFTLRRVVPLVREVLDRAEWTVDDADAFVFHQANLFILKHLSRKLRIPMEKIPVSIDRFGNTSGASIPLTLVAEMPEALRREQRLVFVGFGIGLAWSAVAYPWTGTEIVCPLVEC